MRHLLDGASVRELRTAVENFDTVHSDELASKLTAVATQLRAAWVDLDKYEFGTNNDVALEERKDLVVKFQTLVSGLGRLPAIPAAFAVSDELQQVYTRLHVIKDTARAALRRIVGKTEAEQTRVLVDTVEAWVWESPSRSTRGFALPNPKRTAYDAAVVRPTTQPPARNLIIWEFDISRDLGGARGCPNPVLHGMRCCPDHDLHCGQTRGTTANIQTKNGIDNAQLHDRHHYRNFETWEGATPVQVRVWGRRRGVSTIFSCASNTLQGRRIMSNGLCNKRAYRIIQDPKSSKKNPRKKFGQPSGRDALRSLDGSHSVAVCYPEAMQHAILWTEVAWHVVLLYLQEWDAVKAFGRNDCHEVKQLLKGAIDLFLKWFLRLYPLYYDANGKIRSPMTASIHANVVSLMDTIDYLMSVTEDQVCSVGWASMSAPETSHQITRMMARWHTPGAGVHLRIHVIVIRPSTPDHACYGAGGGNFGGLSAIIHHLRSLAPSKIARLNVGKVLEWSERRFKRNWVNNQDRIDRALECLTVGEAWTWRCCHGDGRATPYTVSDINGKCTSELESADDPVCPSLDICGWKTGPDACVDWDPATPGYTAGLRCMFDARSKPMKEAAAAAGTIFDPVINDEDDGGEFTPQDEDDDDGDEAMHDYDDGDVQSELQSELAQLLRLDDDDGNSDSDDEGDSDGEGDTDDDDDTGDSDDEGGNTVTYSITVPVDARPGDAVAFAVNGQQVTVTVPADVEPGDHFETEVTTAAARAVEIQWADDGDAPMDEAEADEAEADDLQQLRASGGEYEEAEEEEEEEEADDVDFDIDGEEE
eukprot:COSAG01_NODE_499_length_16240_cov_43.337092_15_plen_818_part_00